MNYVIDTHAHTIASGHAYSTIKEMADAAREEGILVQALTEHAPKMPGSCYEGYFHNIKVMPKVLDGVRMLYGTELNIMDVEGTVDLPSELLSQLDVVIASMHAPCYGLGHSKEENTKAYLNIMKNPMIHIIGHPDDGRFPVDFKELVLGAKEYHKLLEVNNSSLRPGGFRKDCREHVMEMLSYCMEYEAPVTVSTDAHCAWDVSNIALAVDVLEELKFPKELIVNDSMEKLAPFINLDHE